MARCVVRCILLSVFACVAASCASAPPVEVTAGRGIVAFDPAPPAGSVVYERPTPRRGDRHVLLRGGRVRQEFTVVAVDATGSVVEDAAHHALRRDTDLGLLGEWGPDGKPIRILVPRDTRYHWPLWVGKQWRCDLIDRGVGVAPLHQEVRYQVEAMDRVTVPAGTFDALRIVRTATLQSTEGAFLDRTSVTWYAPALGLEVRQWIDGTAYELVEWTHGPTAEAATK